MLIVHKYGGTSLQDTPRLCQAARRTAQLARQGHRMVVVVSAQGDFTDRMIRQAEAVGPADGRELDAYLAAGEQMAAALLAMAIQAQGQQAVSLTGWQAGIHTSAAPGEARIESIDTCRILGELDGGKVVVVAGFQGISPEGNITTLGRGGSDTTAVALAAWLRADRCQIFTDVDGIYDRDPRKDPLARRYARVDYATMLALIDSGAQVLHRPSVETARDYRIEVEVLSAFTGAPGTIVGELESL